MHDIPFLGQLEGEICERAVMDAIGIGYRHIDSAQAYRNEREVGNAVADTIRRGIVSRNELFIATKLSDENDAGYENTKRLVQSQLESLQTTYIDLYMLHSPISNRSLQAETWRALEELCDEGKIRALGVSNFDASDLRSLVKSARKKPTVVQNKLDPYHIGKQLDNRGDDIVAYTRREGIVLVSYSPFSAYPFVMKPADDPIVRHIASKMQVQAAAQKGKGSNVVVVTPAQVILRWALQSGFSPIPRSSDPEHLRENFDALSLPPLSDEDMALMGTLQYLVDSPVSKAVAIE